MAVAKNSDPHLSVVDGGSFVRFGMPRQFKDRSLKNCTMADDAVYELLQGLIAKHSLPLQNYAFCILLKQGIKPDKNGKDVMGKTQVLSPVISFLSGYDVLITINAGLWNT